MTQDLPHLSKLAQERGYILKTQSIDDTHIYWVEGSLFIGKPYRSLHELALFLCRLPTLHPLTYRQPVTDYDSSGVST